MIDNPVRFQPIIDEIFKTNGWSFFSGRRNINIVVIRDPNPIAGEFDDVLTVLENGKVTHAWRVTADPGSPATAKNPRGVGRIADGFWRGAWELGYHHAGDLDKRYPALRQRKPVMIERHDKDSDLSDPISKAMELVYANVHAAGTSPFVDPFPHRYVPGRRVGNWSEACIVFADALEYAAEFWPILLLSADIYGPRFSIAVITSPRPLF